ASSISGPLGVLRRLSPVVARRVDGHLFDHNGRKGRVRLELGWAWGDGDRRPSVGPTDSRRWDHSPLAGAGVAVARAAAMASGRRSQVPAAQPLKPSPAIRHQVNVSASTGPSWTMALVPSGT